MADAKNTIQTGLRKNDKNYKILSVEDGGFVSFLEFRNVLKNKYQVK